MIRSLKARLGIGLVVSLVLLFGVQWIAVNAAVRYLTRHYIVSELQREGEEILSAIRPGGDPELRPLRIDPVYKKPYSGHYFQAEWDDHLLRSRSLWDLKLPLPLPAGGRPQEFLRPGPDGQHLLVLVRTVRKKGRTVTLGVARDLSGVEADLGRFMRFFALGSGAILFILIMAQRGILGSGLSPLEGIRKDLLALERGEVMRLHEEAPTELQPLIRQINLLLEAMHRRLERSRRALGNLAHALKTPLTILLQLAEGRELARHPDLQRSLVEQARILRELTERELRRARLAGQGKPGQGVDLEREVAQLLDALGKIYSDKRVEVVREIPPGAVVPGDREDWVEILGNLLDNAFKWSRSRVLIRYQRDGGASVCVEDDGPGCPPDQLERLARRGVRFDESIGGAGLGLAIASEIVTQYSGDMTFGRSERLGGFQACAVFPRPGPPA